MDHKVEGLEIVSVAPETWAMFDAMVVRHNGIFGGCWCMYFHPDSEERGKGAEGNRAMKKLYVERCVAHAALLIDGDEAVAWAEYGTPAELPNTNHRKQYDAEADLTPDYRVTCIFVDKRHRRRGLAEMALLGAVDLIAKAGGGIVEGYPPCRAKRRCPPRSSTTEPGQCTSAVASTSYDPAG